MSIGRSRGEPPIACSLAGEAQVRRRETVRNILDRSRLVGELEDGYEFAFPGDAEWEMRLTEFIGAERSCCPFFTFEINIDSDELLLRVRGLQGTKQFIGEHAAVR